MAVFAFQREIYILVGHCKQLIQEHRQDFVEEGGLH